MLIYINEVNSNEMIWKVDVSYVESFFLINSIISVKNKNMKTIVLIDINYFDQ